jgi:hypothetical protein
VWYLDVRLLSKLSSYLILGVPHILLVMLLLDLRVLSPLLVIFIWVMVVILTTLCPACGPVGIIENYLVILPPLFTLLFILVLALK